VAANEIVLADKWLYSVLAGDTALMALAHGVYSYIAPAGAVSPWVLYNFQGAHDVIAVGAYRIFNSGLYQVKAVGQSNSLAALGAIAERIDVLLDRKTATVTGGVILASHREQPMAYAEQSDGLRYNHLGGIYRIQVQGA
jgi:hypothetical protein